MRRLLPLPLQAVDIYDAYRPHDPHAPLLRLNMIASADGLATDPQGRTGGLAGQGDTELFRTLRALSDCILVGAATVRVEGYGPHRVRTDLRERRAADGREAPAAVAVVSGSLDLDFTAPLFAEARTPTIVVTHAAADPRALRLARRAGRVLLAGEHTVDLVDAVGQLRETFGYRHVLCEGGPTLNDELFRLGLVDELCLTVAPALLGGDGPRIIRVLAHPVPLRLVSVLEDDGELYLRYATGQ